MAYIGNTLQNQSYVPAIDYFSGNGSTTAFTLSRQVASVAQVQAVINNVPQHPSTAFSVSGNTITFTSAPPSGTNNIYVYYTSPNTQVIQPGDGTVGMTQLAQSLQTAMFGSFGFKNRIINGAMMIDQRNAGASVTGSTSNTFGVDRWMQTMSQASKYSMQQLSATPPAGFYNYVRITVVSAYSPASTESFTFRQIIEGRNMMDFAYGTASASSAALSFQVRSSLTGTFGGSVIAGGYSFPFTYTISAANTWESKSVILTPQTFAAITLDYGAYIQFSMGAGSSVITTAGSWALGNYYGATGQTNIIANAAATWDVTGVQLEKGSTATSFDYRPYGTELALCQRYYWQQSTPNPTPYYCVAAGTSSYYILNVDTPVTMRAIPTIGASATTGSYSENRSSTSCLSFTGWTLSGGYGYVNPNGYFYGSAEL